ncbi:hypothetical protein KQI88_05595 [Alkaliphilus sp. MSJ-5]|uniref:Lipoprotein n=1 Tax=Alkaliphilus flagellatus TaxID=2841507 RepID=A0ABS6G2K3_9FIRM|nr:hypothetical protein [Alkaliphilus flagellatus]MBU5675883.1 hypothetical protein [Alkaliphilus flagellatus]
MRNIKMIIILLIIIILNGCTPNMLNIDDNNNEANNLTDVKHGDETDSPIKIHVRDYYKTWSHAGLYSTFLDSYDSKLYIMKEDKIISTIKDFNYSSPILSPDGKHFISIDVEELDQNKKYMFYLFNTETMEKELYTELDIELEFNNEHLLGTIIWNDQGIYAGSTLFNGNYKLLSNDLIMINASGEIQVVWEDAPSSLIEDIIDYWVLYYEEDDYVAYNLQTKESIIYESFRTPANGLNDYSNLKFLEAPTKLIGSKTSIYEEKYTFIYDHEECKKIKIYDEVFIGFSTSGFAYKKYTGNENEHYIYIKPWDFK